MENSVDPNQTVPRGAVLLDLHCLLCTVFLIISKNTVSSGGVKVHDRDTRSLMKTHLLL